ncbi:P22AR C-terminal domain-containing protein [uncultured Aggregatibacter sp.]|uniref:P22AR C-terminal domain-containing protein n=1 Tax=uncultured Aggregatibacter sp. TaxID=470564 RepID=UPI001A517AFF|nr:P22AR C-terminal domain-containing protein [uncultured Aggregatibacter sp.]VTX84042.1 Uncharacterised protein [uncultured Aggregatibacter sp.]
MSNQTQLSTFNFNSLPVRINVIGLDPFFCLVDVAAILGLGNRSVSKFKFNPKGVEKLSTPSNGGLQEMIFINEPNLYRMIFRSNKPEAETFQNWVFEEVLPAIRKTGKYEGKTTADDRTGLRNAVNMLVSKKGLIYSDAYNLVHQYMNVETIEDIPADKLQSAVEYVHRIVLEGELITEPKKDDRFNFEFTEYELQQLAWLWFAFKRGVGTFQHIERAFNVLGSNMSGQIYGQAYEYLSVLRSTNQILNRITKEFEIDPMTNWRVLQHLRQFDPKAVKIDF